MNLNVDKITSHFGAIVNHDVKTLNSEQLIELLNEHKVLVFNNQQLTDEEHIQIGYKFGNVSLGHPYVSDNEGYQEIYNIVASQGGKNAMWHTDVSYIEKPHAISLLRSVDIPTCGGDTLFCDLSSSYETLSIGMKQYLNKLEGVHKSTPFSYVGYPYDNVNKNMCQTYCDNIMNNPPIIHPIVRLHPRTNKPNLFVNPAYTSHVKNIPKIESNHILSMIYEHCLQPEYTLRIKWNNNVLVIFDNTNTMHYATDDYKNYERIMKRITICGEHPIGYDGLISKVSNDVRDRL